MNDCVFCKIIAGEIPSNRIYEDDEVLAIMDAGHVNPGHSLVIVKPHVATVMELDERRAAMAFVVANRVAKALTRVYQPHGLTILQANRPAGWQTVPHFHLHVLPRYAGDGVSLTWPAKNPPKEELASVAAKIRAALEMPQG